MASLVEALKINARRSISLVRWLGGRKIYPWTESPVQRCLTMLSRRANRGKTRLHRLAFIVLCALLKQRERVHADKMNFVATVRGPLPQDALRNMIVWQHAILQNPEIPPTLKIHGNLCVVGDQQDVQLDRLLSLLCLSEVFSDFNIFWGEPAAAEALPGILTAVEQARAAATNVRFDLNAPPGPALAALERGGLPRALVPRHESRRALINYLKIAHPYAFVVALGLPEDEDGFCDAALLRWLPHLRRFRQEMPGVAFCLLNRTTLGQADRESPLTDVAAVRGLGFTLGDAIALAQEANAYLGCLDVFGLAAIGARRPGVYFDPAAGDYHDPERLVWMFVRPTPNQCLAALRVLLDQRLATENRGGRTSIRRADPQQGAARDHA